MRDCRRILTLLTLALPLAAMAEVPVLESSSMQQGSSYPPAGYGTAGASVGAGAQAPASAQGMLFNQLEQMQQEIAQLRGMVEEQQNEIQRLKQEGLERYQDLDQRISSVTTPPSPFTFFRWSREDYDAAMADAGLREVHWQKPMLLDSDIKRYTPGFWDTFQENCLQTGLTCRL